MRTLRKPLLVVALSAGMLATSTTGAFGYGSYGGDDRGGDLRTASYINGDAGKNADVDPNSNCFNPDQYDMQAFSSTASGNPGNIKVDWSADGTSSSSYNRW